MVCQQRRHWKELALCMEPNENKIDMDKDKEISILLESRRLFLRFQL